MIQPRGRSFVDYVAETKGSYEVDTVTESGATQTDQVKISGAFTLQEKAAMYKEFDELDFSRYVLTRPARAICFIFRSAEMHKPSLTLSHLTLCPFIKS